MKETICSVLAELNRDFYSRFAEDFARTRRSWPPGFDRILPHVRSGANVLDLGCGNGRFLHFLQDRCWNGRYVGVDNNRALLEIAAGGMGRGQTRTNADKSAGTASSLPLAEVRDSLQVEFIQADLLAPDWSGRLGDLRPDLIVSIAVLHHIPGATNRARFVAECARLLHPGAALIITTWQFMSSPRLRKRVLPWKTIGLREMDVEPGDYLLSWGHNAEGKRYCAFIEQANLCRMAEDVGLRVTETFYADGKEGNLNLYGVFAK